MTEEIVDIMKFIKQILAMTVMLSVMTPGISASPPQDKDEKQQPKDKPPKVVVSKPKPKDEPRDKDQKKDNKEEKKP